jgi:hypothetical protein
MRRRVEIATQAYPTTPPRGQTELTLPNQRPSPARVHRLSSPDTLPVATSSPRQRVAIGSGESGGPEVRICRLRARTSPADQRPFPGNPHDQRV